MNPLQNQQNQLQSRVTPSATVPESTAEVVEDDGWSTVSKPKKNNRGGNAGARPIAS